MRRPSKRRGRFLKANRWTRFFNSCGGWEKDKGRHNADRTPAIQEKP